VALFLAASPAAWADVAAETACLQDDLKDYEFYPVVSFGIGYRF
jgi:hypothetical protein